MCNHTDDGCTGKREVTCAEARAITGSNNSQGLRSNRSGGSTVTPNPQSIVTRTSSFDPVLSQSSNQNAIRSRGSFDMRGTYLGSALKMILHNRLFAVTMRNRADKTPSVHDLNVFDAIRRVSENPNWDAIREMVLAVESHPGIDPVYYANDYAALQTVVSSLVASSSAAESLLSLRASNGLTFQSLIAQHGFGSSVFENCLFYDFVDNRNMRELAVQSLPNLLLVRIQEWNDRVVPYTEIPFDMNFRSVTEVEPAAGSPNYRLVGIVRGLYYFGCSYEYLDMGTNQWVITDRLGVERRLISGQLPSNDPRGISAVLYQRI
jgi:hypothetical protein